MQKTKKLHYSFNGEIIGELLEYESGFARVARHKSTLSE
jgi:hypothetical protein